MDLEQNYFNSNLPFHLKGVINQNLISFKAEEQINFKVKEDITFVVVVGIKFKAVEDIILKIMIGNHFEVEEDIKDIEDIKVIIAVIEVKEDIIIIIVDTFNSYQKDTFDIQEDINYLERVDKQEQPFHKEMSYRQLQ